MKFAKLGFKTKEGLSLAHFQDGWSMEYGKGGSYQVEILLNGKKVAVALEEGNGGSIDIDFVEGINQEEVSNAVVNFLKRTNKDYGPNTMYEFCKNITTAGSCEYSSMINDLLDSYDYRKKAKSYFKKGYNLMIAIDNGYTNHYVASGNPSKENLLNYAKSKNLIHKDSKLTYFEPTDDLTQDL